MTSGDVTSEIAVDDWERDCLATLLCCDPGRALVSNKCMTNGEHPRILSFQSSVFTKRVFKIYFLFLLITARKRQLLQVKNKVVNRPYNFSNIKGRSLTYDYFLHRGKSHHSVAILCELPQSSNVITHLINNNIELVI